MRGILLAGGTGSRLFPTTLCTSKQLLPVYDKPMIYYPLSVLMMAQIQEILLISTPEDTPRFQKLFGDGSHLGLSISYKVQNQPEGIAHAFVLAESFIQNEPVALVLGDNIFYGHDFLSIMKQSSLHNDGGLIFGYEVKNPSRYGVIDFDENFRVKKVVEKPKDPPSSYAITGLYFYDSEVVDIAKNLKPSSRNELEITDVNQKYLDKGKLHVKLLDRGFAWLDTGTHEALHQASCYVHTIQQRQGIQIGCVEEIAYENGWISSRLLEKAALKYASSEYGSYLHSLLCKIPISC